MSSVREDPYSLARLFIEVRTIIVLGRRPLIVWGLFLAVVLVIGVMLIPNRYTAEASVLPTSGGSNDFGLLRQIAGMTGLGGGGSVESYLQLYPVIARSRWVAHEVFESTLGDRTVAARIGDVENEAEMSPREREKAFGEFRGRIEAESDLRVGYFRLGFTSTDPELAAFVTNSILHRMDVFFGDVVRGNARKRRLMLESRSEAVSDSLRSAEEALERFRSANQSVADSPRLSMHEMRLLREVEVNSAIVIELRKQLEIATVDEESVAPLMNVLDRAQVPLVKSGPPRAAYCVAGFLFGEVLLLSLLAFRRWRRVLDEA